MALRSSHPALISLLLLAACRGAPPEWSPVSPAAAAPVVVAPEEVVRRDAAALSRGDLEGFLALYSPDAKIFGLPDDPHKLVGRLSSDMVGQDRLRAHFAAAFARPPLPRLQVTDTIAFADLVAARVTITDPPRYDAPVQVLTVFRVRDGQIRTIWHIAREQPDTVRVGKAPEQVLHDLMAAANRVDIEAWLALFSPDAKQFKRAVDPDQLANVPSVKAYDQASRRTAYEAVFAATPHGRADILHTISVGDMVVSRGSFTFPDQVMHTFTIYRVRDDLLQDIWDVEQQNTPVAGNDVGVREPAPR